MKEFFSKMFSGGGSVSSKRFAFIAVILAGIVWLSVDLRNGTSDGWVSSFHGLLTVAGGGYVLGKGVERIGKKDEDDNDK